MLSVSWASPCLVSEMSETVPDRVAGDLHLVAGDDLAGVLEDRLDLIAGSSREQDHEDGDDGQAERREAPRPDRSQMNCALPRPRQSTPPTRVHDLPCAVRGHCAKGQRSYQGLYSTVKWEPTAVGGRSAREIVGWGVVLRRGLRAGHFSSTPENGWRVGKLARRGGSTQAQHGRNLGVDGRCGLGAGVGRRGGSDGPCRGWRGKVDAGGRRAWTVRSWGVDGPARGMAVVRHPIATLVPTAAAPWQPSSRGPPS